MVYQILFTQFWSLYKHQLRLYPKGSGCGSVGRADTSDTRGLRFESSHRQKIYILNICLLSTVFRKDKKKKKRPGNGPFLKKKSLYLTLIKIGIWRWCRG